jgi:hypothetical protein
MVNIITAVNAGIEQLSADGLIVRILEEHRSRNLNSGKLTALKAQEPKNFKNNRSNNNRGNSNNRNWGATTVKCFNCGTKGHKKSDCWEKGGGREGQAPKWWTSNKANKDQAKQSGETKNNEFAFSFKPDYSIAPTDWLADSAATTHIARNHADFIEYKDEPSSVEGVAPSSVLNTLGKGTVALEFKVNDKIYFVKLHDVKHAPEALNNLISIGRLTDKGYSASFNPTEVHFRSGTGTIFGEGRKIGCMYQMRTCIPRDFAAVAKSRSLEKWHRILGHINYDAIKLLQRNNLVTGLHIDNSNITQCKACVQAKAHMEPFPKQANDSVKDIGDVIVSDVWGRAATEGIGRERYFYSFTDIKSRHTVLFTESTKDQTLKDFKIYKSFLETQTGKKIKKLRTDNGGKYINLPFKEFCASEGIIMEMMAPYSLAQNGTAE